MKFLSNPCHERGHAMKQRGVVLFFALIALVVMSLAAVALIRSVDTSTMVAGNLAFKRAATDSADVGNEAAIAWLTATQAGSPLNVFMDPLHPFNNDAPANGYYTNANPALDLFADATWNVSTIPEVTDPSGNKIRYIIQRMCRVANQVPTKQNCLYSSAAVDDNGKNIPLPQDVCTGAGCPVAGQTPQIRITARATGPRNTFSYIQAFVY